MSRVSVTGVDPGQVHTGVVRFEFDDEKREYSLSYLLVDGLDSCTVADWCYDNPSDVTYIEAYRPRSHFAGDARMLEMITSLKAVIPRAMVTPNMGIRRVRTTEMLRLLGAWKFPVTSHHQDLRAAAKIALFGMVKNPQWNPILADLVRDHIDGNDWARL